MQTVVLDKPQHFVIRETPIPQPLDGQVQIKVAYVGVCGSDIHYFQHGRIGSYVVEYPFVLGHECSGIISKVGKNVSGLQVGDRVTVEPGDTCKRCNYCTTKDGYNLCPDVQFLATPPYDGCMSNFVCMPQHLVFKVPDSMTLKQACLVEPFAVGMYATRNVVKNGGAVLVTGAGCIGLLAMLAAKYRGASKVYVADILPSRLEMAKKLGSTPIDSRMGDHVKSMESIDAFIECSGNQHALNMAIGKLKKGGTGVLVGLSAQENVPVNLNMVVDKELTLTSVFRYANMFPETINAISKLQESGINVEDIISQSVSFRDAQKVFDDSCSRQDLVKSLIHME